MLGTTWHFAHVKLEVLLDENYCEGNSVYEMCILYKDLKRSLEFIVYGNFLELQGS